MSEDFSKLTFDITKEGYLIDNYPELSDYPYFTNENNDIYAKLVVLITDEFSPFVRKNKEFKGIVEDACDYLSIKDSVLIRDILMFNSDNEEVAKIYAMQDIYFRHVSKWEFNLWYDLMWQYHENSMVLRTPVDPGAKDYERRTETKQKIRASQIELQKQLINYESIIFPKGSNIKKVITQNVAKVTNWPERMAKSKPEFY